MESEGFSWGLCPFVVLSSVAQISVVTHQGAFVPCVKEDTAFKQFGMGGGKGLCALILQLWSLKNLPSFRGDGKASIKDA